MANESTLKIGIDGYHAHPLTGADIDAWSFRNALLKRKLVEPAGIEILTSPLKMVVSVNCDGIHRTEASRWGPNHPAIRSGILHRNVVLTDVLKNP